MCFIQFYITIEFHFGNKFVFLKFHISKMLYYVYADWNCETEIII
jgi:hypothetical protein